MAPIPPPVDAPLPRLDDADFSGAWKAVALLLSGFAYVYVAILQTTGPCARHFRDFALVWAAPGQRLFAMQSGLASLALMLLMLEVPALRFTDRAHLWVQVAVILAIAGLFFTAIALCVNVIYRWRWEKKRWEWEQEQGNKPDDCLQPTSLREIASALVASVLVWMTAIGLLGFWGTLFSDHDSSGYGFFFAYRCIYLASGVSPLTPMLILLAAIFAWMLFEIRRLRFNDQFRPRLNPRISRDGSFTPEQSCPGSTLEKDIAEAVNRYWLRPAYLVCLFVAFGGWLAFLDLPHPFETFEKSTFVCVYGLLFALVVFMMLATGFRLSQIWSELSRFLQAIERSPIRNVFSRLKESSWTPIWRQGGGDAEWVNMGRSLEVLQFLGNRVPADSLQLEERKALKRKLEAIQARIKTLTLTRNSEGSRLPVPVDVKLLQQDLTELREGINRLGSRPLLASAVDECWSKANHPELFDSDLSDIQSILGGVLSVLNLLDARVGTDAAANKIRESYRQLQECPSALPVLSNILSYHDGLKRLNGNDRKESANTKTANSPVDHFRRFSSDFCDVQRSLAEVLSAALRVLGSFASQCPEFLEDGRTEPSQKDSARTLPTGKLKAGRRNLKCVEEYVALRYVAFIRGALEHVRDLLLFLAISFSLALLSLNVYSFQPHRSLSWSLVGIFLLVAISAVLMLMQIHRDQVLSRITGTKPNTLGIAFYLRVAAFGAVPLLTLLATNFPSIGSYLLSLLQPGLEALK